MKLQGHLLYIDITQICGIGCTFCMYADKHQSGKSMVLSMQARENLARLINDQAVKRISVSGEGEPLNNIKTFHEILALSNGGRHFEFITSGFLRHEKMIDFYEETNRIVLQNGDSCNIRLSSDSHHIDKIKWRAHGLSLDYLRRSRPEGLSFSFRSIDIDREFTRRYLLDELAAWGIEASIEACSVLEDTLVVGEEHFPIDYKNLVHPTPETPPGYLDLAGYVAAIESKVNKRFTFGSLNQQPQENGMDVTVKPDGSVYLYGIETRRLGNINFDKLSWSQIAAWLRQDPLARTLYTQPLTALLARLEGFEHLPSSVARANNPYWLVKELAKHPGLLEQWETA